jgi:hypothetical protein
MVNTMAGMNKRVANATVAFATQYIVAKGLNSKPLACVRDFLLLYNVYYIVANATGSICYSFIHTSQCVKNKYRL